MTDSPQKTPNPRRTIIGLIFACVLLALVVAFCLFTHIAEPWPVVPAQPKPGPGPNAFDIYAQAHSLLLDTNESDNAYMTTPLPGAVVHSQAELDRVAAENEPVVVKMREAFLYPYVAPPVKPTFGTDFPELAENRAVARMLAFIGRTNAKRGRWDDALDDEIDAEQMGVQMSQGRNLIGELVAFACEAIGRRHAWDVVSHVSAAEAGNAAKRLAVIDAEGQGAARVLRNEEQFTQASLEVPNKSFPTIVRKMVAVNYTTYMDAYIRNASLTYPRNLSAPQPKMPHDIITSMLVPAYSKFRFKLESSNALNRLLDVSLALQAYKSDHGGYPTKLDALTPKYLPSVPIDPFTDGAPLSYHRTAHAYVLYSVGPDCKDDGGKPIFDGARKPTSRYLLSSASQTGDIVAGVNY